MSDTPSALVPPDLLGTVYADLRKLAARRLSAEHPGHTLQATALVHEVYLRLGAGSSSRWADPAHFFHAAAEAMRRMLVDHARARRRAKRGGGAARVPLTETMNVASLAEGVDPDDVLALDAAVTRLEAVNPEAASVVRLRFYAGLSVEDTAEALHTSPRTVKRKWAYARAWLYRELTSSNHA